jgi:uridine kinase
MSKTPGIEIVGIAAPTCAGKTTLLAELQRRMPTSVATLSFDEYDLYPAGSEAMSRELGEEKISNWEDPALFDMEQYVADLGRIAQGQNVTLQTRSRESIALGHETRIFRPASTNIAEGVFVLHDKRARALMDLSVFIDIPLDVMVARRLATLRPGSAGNPWDNQTYIMGAMVEGTERFVLPQREHAQLVLDGLLSTQELADRVMACLQ